MSKFRLLVAVLAFLPLSVHAANVVQLENAKPGTSGWALFSVAANHEIEGYASATSVNRGESIELFVHTIDTAYTINVYRMGWYGGLGARRLAGPIARAGVVQPMPEPDPETGLIECNWSDPYVLHIPDDPDPTEWASGVYLAKLTATNLQKDSYIVFVVRDDERPANHLFQTADTTYQAYNDWGGRSLYSTPQASHVSYNRPYAEGAGAGSFVWRWEYNMVRFLEREGYDVTYSSNVDTHRRGHLLTNYESFLSVGHDEYWTWEMRQNVTAARDAGVGLGIFSANTCYWQMRFEPSAITGDLDRTIVSYKENADTHDPYALDATAANDHLVTAKFRDAPVNAPEAALLGVQYVYNTVDTDIVIDDVTTAPWVFAETNLQPGDVLPGLLGYEIDAMAPSTPPGTVRLGHSPFFNTFTNQPDHSHMTVYQAPSGATVFATGSIQWAWGLDDWNSSSRGSRLNADAQQITRNVLRRFAEPNTAADCQFDLSATSTSATNAAGTGAVSVSTSSWCDWTVSSNASWLDVTSAASGTGPFTVTYSYPSNNDLPRTGTISIADRTFTVHQAGNCVYTITPAEMAFEKQGGNGTLQVSTNLAGCEWSVLENATWISITSPLHGTGNGTVNFSVAQNTTGRRNATITIGDTVVRISQSSGCTYFVNPTQLEVPIEGGTFSSTITAPGACFWTASSQSPFITVEEPSAGSGAATVSYTVMPNPGTSPRTGTITIAGNKVTITQRGCTYDVAPLSARYAASAGAGAIQVTSADQCAWTAAVETGGSFVTITSGANGGGDGTVNYSIAANPTISSRQATLRVAGELVTITQNGQKLTVNAQASGASSVAVTWNAILGATGYQVFRASNGGSFALVGSTSSTSFNDTTVAAGVTYLYRVHAVENSDLLLTSNVDPATTVAFTTIVPGVTPVRASHVIELRTAVNAMRAAAGLAPASFSAISAGALIRGSHIIELRTALDQARSALGLPALTYTDASLGGVPIRAVHFEEIRAGVR